jgi:hypothetical protein
MLLIATSAISAQTAMAQPFESPLQPQVMAALAQDKQIGADAIGGDLEILTPLTSLPAATELRVVSYKAGFAPGIQVMRLECLPRQACLPFHVIWHSRNFVARKDAPRQTSPGDVSAALRNSPRPGDSGDSLARTGDHAELVAEFSGIRLRAKVVCLESGVLGQRIRVQNLGTHRTLVATIAGKNLLRVE